MAVQPQLGQSSLSITTPLGYDVTILILNCALVRVTKVLTIRLRESYHIAVGT